MSLKIFGISIWTILMVFALLWVGFKFGSKIPLVNSL